MVAQDLRGLLVPMCGQVIEDDDCALGDLWDQHFVDVGGKGRAIHRALDDPWCDQCILCQPSDQGLGSPTSKRRIHRQALAPLCPSMQADQIGLHRGFINEDNAIRQGCDGGRAMFEPVRALLPYLGATALGGNQRFFCM